MSQDNVEVVRSLQPSGIDLVAALAGEQQGPLRANPSLFSGDLESTFIGPGLRSETRHGFDGFAAGWRNWLEAWQRYEVWPEDFIDAGDAVVVFVRVNALTRRDAIPMEHAPAAVWTLRDGIVCRIDFYYERAEALNAVGLGE
jgi:ketosteroid isomerase-like protein